MNTDLLAAMARALARASVRRVAYNATSHSYDGLLFVGGRWEPAVSGLSSAEALAWYQS